MKTRVAVVRIGAGAGYSGDRIEPAIELAASGAHRLPRVRVPRRADDRARTAGAATRSGARLRSLPRGADARRAAGVPRRGIRIVTNAGAANPIAAARAVAGSRASSGCAGFRVAAVVGDDVLALVQRGDADVARRGEPVATLGDSIVSANAYLGAEPIVEALARRADVVITGRVADSSLFRRAAGARARLVGGRLGRARRGTAGGHLSSARGR